MSVTARKKVSRQESSVVPDSDSRSQSPASSVEPQGKGEVVVQERGVPAVGSGGPPGRVPRALFCAAICVSVVTYCS